VGFFASFWVVFFVNGVKAIDGDLCPTGRCCGFNQADLKLNRTHKVEAFVQVHLVAEVVVEGFEAERRFAEAWVVVDVFVDLLCVGGLGGEVDPQQT
jgi:hypothetical protein